MTTDNAATVDAFYESERQRDIESWVRFWHEDGRHVFPGVPEAEVRGLRALRRTTEAKFADRPPYEIRTTIASFEDADHVFARLHLTSDSPEFEEAHLWCIFHFDEDGLIYEVEEMVGSLP